MHFLKLLIAKRSQKMIRGIVKGTEITIYDIFYEKKDKEGKILMTNIVIIMVKHMTKTTATRKLV